MTKELRDQERCRILRLHTEENGQCRCHALQRLWIRWEKDTTIKWRICHGWMIGRRCRLEAQLSGFYLLRCFWPIPRLLLPQVIYSALVLLIFRYTFNPVLDRRNSSRMSGP